MTLITSIQKYSIHDGDGIRTTVFFKGCPLRCAWCHNPETQKFKKELSCNEERCAGCGACVNACPQGAVSLTGSRVVTDRNVCTACGRCTDVCALNLREVIGREYSVDDLFKELMKDEMFYDQSGGGVTLSGGEVMAMDMGFIEALCKKLTRYGVSITIDTCGQAPFENLQRLLPYVDTFLYDIKTLDPALHQKYIGGGNVLILQNLIKLNAAGAKVYIRIPVIREVNGNDRSIKEIIAFLQENQIRPACINLLPYHNTGMAKYEHLGMNYPGAGFTAPDKDEMECFAGLFRNAGFSPVKIGG